MTSARLLRRLRADVEAALEQLPPGHPERELLSRGLEDRSLGPERRRRSA